MAAPLHTHYGAPSTVYVIIEAKNPSPSDTAELAVTLQWIKKTTTRLPGNAI
jgi:hypothetical protein